MTKILTASIIAKNEEEMIGTMLDSIKGVDEVMVVDTGSTDNTVKICKEKGAKVFRGYKWNDNFAEARNVAKDKSKGEWLLIIDCDEIFKEDVTRLRDMLQEPFMKDFDAVFMSVDTGMEVNQQIRCFRNLDNIEWYGAAHNLPYYDTEKGPMRIPDNKIFKSSFNIKANYSPNHDRDPDRTLRILTKELRKNPNNTRYIYYVAREYLMRKNVYAAIFWLERYCKISPPTNELADAYYLLSTCYADTGDIHKAIDMSLQSVKLLPSYKAPWVLLYNAASPEYKVYFGAAMDKADNKGVLFVRDIAEKIREDGKG